PGVDAVAAAKLQDFLELPVDRVVFIEEVFAAAGEGAELAAEHRLAGVPVGAVPGAVPVKGLFRSVVEARDAERHHVESKSAEYPLRLFLVGAETGLVSAFADLVVVVEQGDDLVAEPGVRALPDQFGVAEQGEILGGITVALGQEFEFVRYV